MALRAGRCGPIVTGQEAEFHRGDNSLSGCTTAGRALLRRPARPVRYLFHENAIRFWDAIRQIGKKPGDSATGPAPAEFPQKVSNSGADPEWLDRFKAEVKQGAARAFEAISADHPGEQIYAFAVYSDNGAMTVCPAANSEEAYSEKSRAADPSHLVHYRWNTGDWAYEFEHVEVFAGAVAMLDDLRRAMGEEAYYRGVREDVFRTMAAALEELNVENVFGTGAARERITVFFTISDGGEEWEAYSVPRCNPPAVAERFLRETNNL